MPSLDFSEMRVTVFFFFEHVLRCISRRDFQHDLFKGRISLPAMLNKLNPF